MNKLYMGLSIGLAITACIVISEAWLNGGVITININAYNEGIIEYFIALLYVFWTGYLLIVEILRQ